MIKTPCYVYDIDHLRQWIETIKQEMAGIPLTFSVKANSFVLDRISGDVSHIEVCSPGELYICKNLGIAPEKIIYSGVMKEESDIREAIEYHADILTAESPNHFQMISSVAEEMGVLVKVLLRISSDNQFGMDPEDIYTIVRNAEKHKSICIYGFHYYSGTQKKRTKQIESDIQRITEVTEICEREYGYNPALVEYGPGLAVEYFKENGEELDLELLKTVTPLLKTFAEKAPLGIEMGRFIIAGCGTYYSTVKDLKTNYGIQYAILDGGIHHLKYHGQIMAMPSPVIAQRPCRDDGRQKYTLCGSLCTVADVLAKDVELQPLQTGDVLAFQRCGAYSVTEASNLFLSRDLPIIYLRENEENKPVRGAVKASQINTTGYGI